MHVCVLVMLLFICELDVVGNLVKLNDEFLEVGMQKSEFCARKVRNWGFSGFDVRTPLPGVRTPRPEGKHGLWPFERRCQAFQRPVRGSNAKARRSNAPVRRSNARA